MLVNALASTWKFNNMVQAKANSKMKLLSARDFIETTSSTELGSNRTGHFGNYEVLVALIHPQIL